LYASERIWKTPCQDLSITPEEAAPSASFRDKSIVLTDRLGNAYFVRDAEVRLSKGIQHSYHEETDAPTEGYFEKAYIDHGSLCSDGSYDYMVAVQATPEQLERYAEELPYSVLRADSTAHIVKDSVSGLTGCSAFGQTAVDGLIVSVSPSVLMYRQSGDEVEMSVSNPDLALYSGDSDEVFEENGKRKERSVYGRAWVNNPSQPRTVEMVMEGEWMLSDNNADVTVAVLDGRTYVKAVTFECNTVVFKLKKR